MNKLKAVKGVIKKLLVILFIILGVLLISFVIHIHEINLENSMLREIDQESTATDVMIDIHPRGQVTDKWEKDNAFPNKIIYARIYEATVNNNSDGLMLDWSIRLNITEDCFLNNAWCGTVEVHQLINGTENVQTIDLRNYDEKDIELVHYVAGQDLLIPLSSGDYIVYHSDGTGVSGESPLGNSKNSSGQANVGLIMYSESGDVDFSDFKLDYYIKKSYLSGDDGFAFTVLFAAWLLLFMISLVVSALVLHFEGRLYSRNRLVEESFRLCAAIADMKDPYIKDHSRRTAKYAKMIAEQMGMAKDDCENVYYVAMLHDIGNYFVAEQILRKSGSLSKEEFEAIKNHTRKGAEMLEDMESLPHVVEGALYHHERYDGNGYPTGIKGDEIPLIARIISVADAFDAMNSDRAYRNRLQSESIKRELRDNSGSQFDPVIVGVFMEIIDKIQF